MLAALCSLKVRLALASCVLIGLGVAVTIFFVLHDFGERTQRAALDAEQANSERFADVLFSRLVGLQTSMRSAVTKCRSTISTTPTR